jgi:cytochrome d ubiquinol oxidase subunit II
VLLAAVFGTALGNLVRGVPVGEEGLPGMPLFTNFRPGREPGILDWYTTLVGLFTLVALSGHGALYLAWKTAGPVRDRSLAFGQTAWRAVAVLWVAVTAATAWVQPGAFANLVARPWSLIFVAMAVGGLAGAWLFPRQGRELASFVSSSAFLFGMLAATMIGNYPYWLRSTIDASFSLTAANSIGAPYGMRVALAWWVIGITLAASYFTYLFRSMRGKLGAETGAGY